MLDSPEKKSFWGSLKSLVVEETPDIAPPQPEVPKKPTTPPSIQLNTGDLGLGTIPQSVITGSVNEEFRQVLLDSLNNAKLPSPNYLDFKKSVQTTSSLLIGVPEDKIFQTVFATMAVNGATVQKLTSTGEQFLSILDNERSEFEKSIEGCIDSEVTSRQTHIDSLQKQNEEKVALIAKLTEEIQTNKEEAKKLEVEILEQNSQIEKNVKDFEATHQLIYSQLKGDLEKIAQYLATSN
jgi:hypothetical protein